MQDSPATPTYTPTAAEVARSLAGELEEIEGTVDRVVIERATDIEYVARIYVVDAADYEAVNLRFDTDG